MDIDHPARLADAFVVMGLPHGSPPVRFRSADEALPAPLTDLAVVQPQRDTDDNGFTIIASTVAGRDADVNQGMMRQQVSGCVCRAVQVGPVPRAATGYASGRCAG
jgi:hypothetical protein